MVLGGLWHGRAWDSLLWGGSTAPDWSRALPARRDGRPPACLRCLRVFNLVVLGWILFRSETRPGRERCCRGLHSRPPRSNTTAHSGGPDRVIGFPLATHPRSTPCGCAWSAPDYAWARPGRCVAVVGATVPARASRPSSMPFRVVEQTPLPHPPPGPQPACRDARSSVRVAVLCSCCSRLVGAPCRR